ISQCQNAQAERCGSLAHESPRAAKCLDRTSLNEKHGSPVRKRYPAVIAGLPSRASCPLLVHGDAVLYSSGNTAATKENGQEAGRVVTELPEPCQGQARSDPRC